MVTDASGNVSFGGTAAMSTSFLRNRIINGDMRVDQRNAGASVTINTASQTYTLDRWKALAQATDGVFTVQQSTTASTGFLNALLVTVTTADASIGSTQFYVVQQTIEGVNITDLAWGTASAATVTVSFWVRSSVTGTFSGSLKNSDGSRAYPFTFVINAANTYEQKSVTIAGDTSGTWLTTTGIGITLTFNVGSGSSRLGTANAWAAANLDGATGSTSLISTLSATLYITGVQFEVGSVATPFERQIFSNQLAQCQRYFCKTFDISTAPSQNSNVTNGAIWGCVRAFGGASGSSWEPQQNWYFPVATRAAPTVTVYAVYTGITSGQWGNSSTTSAANTRVLATGTSGAIFDNAGTTVAFGSNSPALHATASSEL